MVRILLECCSPFELKPIYIVYFIAADLLALSSKKVRRAAEEKRNHRSLYDDDKFHDHLKLKMDLYIDQIKFLKDLIIIQEALRIATIRSNGMNQHNLTATNEQ